MFAYEFYWFDKTEKPHYIGILPEKRENPLRITRESVLKLGRKVIGSIEDVENLYFIQVEVGNPSGINGESIEGAPSRREQ
jgi:hypothetical protein